MSNLVKELGLDYFIDRFNGCMFRGEDGTIHAVSPRGILEAKRECVEAAVIQGPPECATIADHVYIPYKFFSSLAVFRTPTLGWRQASQGRYLVFLQRNNRSYMRAITPSILQQHHAPSTKYLYSTNNLDTSAYVSHAALTHMVMEPEYTPFREGVEKMRAGELFSFCVSAQIAVIPEVDDQQAIYFNKSRVGTVNKQGEIVCEIPTIRVLLRDQCNV